MGYLSVQREDIPATSLPHSDTSENPKLQLLSLVLEMQADGCSLIPVGKDKKPLVAWKKYQIERASDAQLQQWHVDQCTTGFAVVCGGVSGGLEVLDFDDPQLYQRFMEEAPAWATDLPAQRTGGGGYQVAYRRPNPGRNIKLAWAPTFDADGVKVEGREIGIETRGQGGYAIIPFSKHPSGNFYQPERGSLANIPTITDQQAEELLALAQSYDQTPAPDTAAVPQKRAQVTVSTGVGPEARYVAKAVSNELDQLANSHQGGRNDQLYRTSLKLGNLVGAGAVDEAEIRTALAKVGRQIGLEAAEISTAIDNGMRDGKLKPRALSHVGQPTGGKQQASQALADKAQALAPAQLSAADLPDPEGEGGAYYSDEQIVQFLDQQAWEVLDSTGDKAHAHRYKQLAQGDALFVQELGGYVVYKQPVWVDSTGKKGRGLLLAQLLASGLSRYMQPELDHLLELFGVLSKEASKLKADGAPKEEISHATHRAKCMEKAYFAHRKAAKRLEKVKPQYDVLDAAAPLLQARIDLFEPKPWLVAFTNGTWDKGHFRPARREDYQLQTAGVAYDPQADQTVWLEVLDRMTGGDQQLAMTLQDVAGYALSGASSKRILPWPYGPAGTGKSTFTELLQTVLAGYGVTLDPKKLSKGEARERLGYDLWGKRVVICAEAGNGYLDAELLKTLSGSDRVPARKLFSEAFAFNPTHVLFMVANDPPKVEAYDEALKDRVLALPFTHRLDAGGKLPIGDIEAVRRDPNSDLAKGFAAWAVEGLARVYQTGEIYRAPVCQQATRAFWEDVDPLTDFWLEQDISALALGVSVTELRQQYEAWCDQQGARPLGRNKWNTAARAVGLEQVSRAVKEWVLQHPAKYPGQPPADQSSTVSRPFDRFEGNSQQVREKVSKADVSLEAIGKQAQNGRTVESAAAGWEGEEL